MNLWKLVCSLYLTFFLLKSKSAPDNAGHSVPPQCLHLKLTRQANWIIIDENCKCLNTSKKHKYFLSVESAKSSVKQQQRQKKLFRKSHLTSSWKMLFGGWFKKDHQSLYAFYFSSGWHFLQDDVLKCCGYESMFTLVFFSSCGYFLGKTHTGHDTWMFRRFAFFFHTYSIVKRK